MVGGAEGPHGGGGGSGSPAPFLTKTYDMVDDPSTDAIVSWSSSGSSFVVWKPLEFARDLLHQYFKHNNFSSFVRQLNTYGFRKVDPDQWEFANEEFMRGQKHLLKNIHRRKPIHSHSLHHQGQHSGPLADAERHELEEEIEKLKGDKGMLILELQKHTQEQHGLEGQMHHLEERLQNVEQRQRNMIDFLSGMVQRPGFLSNFIQQSDLHGKKRRLPKTDFLFEDANVEDNQIATVQAMSREKSDGVPVHPFDIEPFEKMESSISTLEIFFRNVSQVSGGDLFFDDAIASASGGVVLTELHASSGETELNLQSPSPNLHPSSPCLRDIHSSPELAESTSPAESPGLPLLEYHQDTRSKASVIDVNAEPAAPEVHLLTDRAAMNSAPASHTRVNDVFWEQFLTETPGSTDTQEAQLDRRDDDDKRNGVRTGECSAVWWNRKNVDHLTEQLGHLTPAERT